jgi:hypothetical protein
MNRFEELQDIINKNKSKTKSKKEKELLEVSGLSESNSEGQGQPRIEYADDQSDGPIVDQLYRSSRHKPLDGSNATYWDPD